MSIVFPTESVHTICTPQWRRRRRSGPRAKSRSAWLEFGSSMRSTVTRYTVQDVLSSSLDLVSVTIPVPAVPVLVPASLPFPSLQARKPRPGPGWSSASCAARRQRVEKYIHTSTWTLPSIVINMTVLYICTLLEAIQRTRVPSRKFRAALYICRIVQDEAKRVNGARILPTTSPNPRTYPRSEYGVHCT